MTNAIDTILLAAGRGTRFGGDKLLAPWSGGCVLEASLRSAFNSPGRVHLVLPPDGEAMREISSNWASRFGRREDLITVIAHDCQKGLSASLCAGVRSAAGAAGVVIFLGDMPSIPVAAGALVKHALSQGAAAAALSVSGRRGHPVGFSSQLFEDLLNLQGDQGAAAVLSRLGTGLVLIEAQDDGIFLDIDTPDDLLRVRPPG